MCALRGAGYLWSTYAGGKVSFNNGPNASPVLTLPGHVYGGVVCGLRELGGVGCVEVQLGLSQEKIASLRRGRSTRV
jgi:hypothetical protein